eukprot:5186-Heterococcus_DN1.PRE.5
MATVDALSTAVTNCQTSVEVTVDRNSIHAANSQIALTEVTIKYKPPLSYSGQYTLKARAAAVAVAAVTVQHEQQIGWNCLMQIRSNKHWEALLTTDC